MFEDGDMTKLIIVSCIFYMFSDLAIWASAWPANCSLGESLLFFCNHFFVFIPNHVLIINFLHYEEEVFFFFFGNS